MKPCGDVKNCNDGTGRNCAYIPAGSKGCVEYRKSVGTPNGAVSGLNARVRPEGAALDEIIELEGKCIYGCVELSNAPQEVKDAFRLGSYKAYGECVRIAKSARVT